MIGWSISTAHRANNRAKVATFSRFFPLLTLIHIFGLVVQVEFAFFRINLSFCYSVLLCASWWEYSVSPRNIETGKVFSSILFSAPKNPLFYLSILLVQHPHGSIPIYFHIVSVNTSKLFNQVIDESLGWFLVRV